MIPCMEQIKLGLDDCPKEAKFSLSNVKRQMLHARLLGFTHPMTGKKLAFEVPLPKDMSDVVQVLESHRV